MSIDPEMLREVVAQTEVLRRPRQMLSTFGTTSMQYYLLTEPAYRELLSESSTGDATETVVRRGMVTSERPQIVTPYYLLNLFHGFEHGKEFARYLMDTQGAHSPGLMYSYRQELKETSIVSDPLPSVAGRLADQLDQQGDNLAVVVRGVDHMWDVSLMKFIYELTIKSIGGNVADLERRGLLAGDRGLPHGVRRRIDDMFGAVARGEVKPPDLKAELDRWGVFSEYEDRFLDLFRKG